MAGSPRRYTFTDLNGQRIVAVTQFITHLKGAGATRTEIFMVGGHSFVAQGTVAELENEIWL